MQYGNTVVVVVTGGGSVVVVVENSSGAGLPSSGDGTILPGDGAGGSSGEGESIGEGTISPLVRTLR